MSLTLLSSSSSPARTVRGTIFGLWTRVSRGDIETQSESTSEATSTMVSLPSLSVPTPAFTQPSSSRSRPMYTDAVDDFFGVTSTSRLDSHAGTRVSRHDDNVDTGAQSLASEVQPSDITSSIDDDAQSTKPPSYNQAVSVSPSYHTTAPQQPSILPSYSQTVHQPSLSKKSPPTLSMYLFKYGFICPVFWAFGAFLLLWPLTPPESYLPEADPVARALFARRVRNTEVRWATRCLAALVALLVMVLLAVVLALAVTKLT